MDRIYESRASTRALDAVEDHVDGVDEVFRSAVLFMRDALVYLELKESIKSGDVGRLENLVPTLMARMQGGGNKNYVLHYLELFQSLKCEWNDDIKWVLKQESNIVCANHANKPHRKLVMHYNWLVTTD